MDVFVRQIRPGDSKLPVVLVGVKPSPSRTELMPAMRRTNELIRRYASEHESITYVSMFEEMLDAHGLPRRVLFLEDMLHMNASGYALWRDILTPVLRPRVH